jgi:hypothetical protein
MADPRRIIAVIPADCEETWKEAAACGIMIHQDNNNNDDNIDQQPKIVPLFQPQPRLWQPDPLIEHVLLPLLKQELAGGASAAHHKLLDHNHTVNRPEHSRGPTTTFEIWDLGSGVGRDVAFLAEELLRHSSSATTTPLFRVVGLDQRYRQKTTGDHETLAFWKRRYCESVTECRCIDLNDIQSIETELLSGIQGAVNDDGTTTAETRRVAAVKCLYAVRYWNRALFELVAQLGRDRILEPGTIVAISQFGKPYIGALWEFAHPKVRSILS